MEQLLTTTLILLHEYSIEIDKNAAKKIAARGDEKKNATLPCTISNLSQSPVFDPSSLLDRLVYSTYSEIGQCSLDFEIAFK